MHTLLPNGLGFELVNFSHEWSIPRTQIFFEPSKLLGSELWWGLLVLKGTEKEIKSEEVHSLKSIDSTSDKSKWHFWYRTDIYVVLEALPILHYFWDHNRQGDFWGLVTLKIPNSCTNQFNNFGLNEQTYIALCPLLRLFQYMLVIIFK